MVMGKFNKEKSLKIKETLNKKVIGKKTGGD